jgi:leucyl-tRNA synthetase
VNARDVYREATLGAGLGMHRDVLLRYAEMQALIIAPITPHWAEYIWLDVLKKVSPQPFSFNLFVNVYTH